MESKPDLQFEEADYDEETEPPDLRDCGYCAAPLDGRYYEIDDRLSCATCHARMSSGARLGHYVRAFLFGCIGAFLGALIDFAVTQLTGYQIGLVAIVMGILVGIGVRLGSRGQGGLAFQFMALFLAYLCIAGSLSAQIVAELARNNWDFTALAEEEAPAPELTPTPLAPPSPEARPDPAESPVAEVAASTPGSAASPAPESEPVTAGGVALALLLLIGLILVVPVVSAFSSPITILIYGFALYQAWVMNRRCIITGPYELAGPGSTADVVDD